MLKGFLGKLAIATVAIVPLLTIGEASVSAQDNYGAIAWSSLTQAKGYSWNYGSRAAAETKAYNECERRAGTGDCDVLLWFRNACGSIAESYDGAAGTGWGTSTALAERYALESCSGVGNGCTVTYTFCTD